MSQRSRTILECVVGLGLLVVLGVAFGVSGRQWSSLDGRSGPVGALKEHCAEQAKRVLVAGGWPLDGSVVNDTVAHYTSHFSARLGRCLMLVAYTTNDPRDRETRKHYTVVDAFEQATYAEYFETALPGFSTAVIQCDLTLPKEKPVLCRSANEWNRLVEPYMGSATPTQ